ncbi:MAG: hypothetical protein IH888_00300 [Planctomycetes bacterium]|nr:hypothetical protein [Planctomycetota bacterium]
MISRRLIVLVALAGAVAIAAGVWWMSWLAPTWWVAPEPLNQRWIDLAGLVEKRLAQETHRKRTPGTSWTIRLREQQLNAWLATRLLPWVAHFGSDGNETIDWPSAVGPPQVHLSEEGLSVAVEMVTGGRSRFVEAQATPKMSDGGLQLNLKGTRLGRVPIPRKPGRQVLRLLGTMTSATFVEHPMLKHLVQIADGREPINPTLTLADGRTVRLTAIRCGKGFLDLTLETLPPTSKPRPGAHNP